MWKRMLLVFMAVSCRIGTAQMTDGPKVRFDSVSIKENVSGDEQGYMVVPPNSDRLVVKNTPMFRVIGFAFHKERNDLIEGLPEWAHESRWDIDAVVEPESLAEFHKMSFDQQSELLQQILASRCGLVAKEGKKEVPVYALTVSKSGLKTKEVPAPAPGIARKPDAPAVGWDIRQSRGQIHARAITIEGLVYALSKAGLSRPVVDRTGLKGRYNFDLVFTPEDSPTADPGGNGLLEGPPPSLFVVLQEESGLKLEASKAFVDAVIVSHIEKPSPN